MIAKNQQFGFVDSPFYLLFLGDLNRLKKSKARIILANSKKKDISRIFAENSNPALFKNSKVIEFSQLMFKIL